MRVYLFYRGAVARLEVKSRLILAIIWILLH